MGGKVSKSVKMLAPIKELAVNIVLLPKLFNAFALGVSIRGLWKIIGLLEQRKLGLERQIREMEAYLMKGAAVIENEIEQ